VVKNARPRLGLLIFLVSYDVLAGLPILFLFFSFFFSLTAFPDLPKAYVETSELRSETARWCPRWCPE
jgi:hypothetical protein